MSLREQLKQQLVVNKASTSSITNVDEPEHVFYRLSCEGDCEKLNQLLISNTHLTIVDSIHSQLKDLVKLENPSLYPMSDKLYQEKITQKLGSSSPQEYGVWVYYPWKNQLVHMLDESDFVKCRTIRNAYKIKTKEQETLRGKRIGVVGLSVGQSVAMALMSERIGGELRLADFDDLELSNLNRIRAGVSDIGILKCVITRREIATIDPFLKVKTFSKGLTKDNIEEFLEKDGKLDVVVDECDSFDMKITIRKHCKRLGIPVVMETSDRGMLDVERYDLNPEYPLLHGLVAQELIDAEQLTADQKKKLVFQFIDVNKASTRGRISLLEIGKTITTWPQLASDVILGGAVVAMTCRLILLGQCSNSFRHYVDVPSMIIGSKHGEVTENENLD